MSYDNFISNQFIKIPNVICNSNLSVNAKYLYGWIQNEIYFGGFTKCIDDINQILGCSSSTTRKCLKELKLRNFIKIEIIKGNIRNITPLINDSMIIMEKQNVKELRSQNVYDNIIEFDEVPQCFKDFLNAMK